MPSTKLFIAGLVAALHSFTFVSATADAEPPLITPAPTTTGDAEELARRQVAGAPGTPILSTLHYQFTDLHEQVYPFQVLRGPQFGINRCNDTTLGPNSNCQTLIFNSIDDFCLWGSPDPNGQIGNVEAKVVAYCTKDTHGTRVIPPGAITGLQWTKTSAYIQVVGFIKNPGIGLDPNDQGGELDPHGADLQGNPLGGVVFSNGTADSDGHTLEQVFNWNTFVGGNSFCFKACFNSITDPDYCENRYDLVGCSYNMPSAAKDGEFTECEGELQDVVGVYTSAGQTLTWSMPDPLVTPPPYTPRIPASSNCKTFQSTDLFAALPTSSGSVPAGATTGAAGSKGTSGAGSGSSGAAAGSSQSDSANSPQKTGSGAMELGVSVGFMGFVAGVAAVLL